MTITSDRTENGVLLAGYAVCGTIDIVLGASCIVLGLPGSVLFAARLLPGGSSCEISNRLNDGALDGVELAGGLAEKRSAMGGAETTLEKAHLG